MLWRIFAPFETTMKMRLHLALLLAFLAFVAHADEGPAESTVSTSTTSAATSKLSGGWKLLYCTVATKYRTGGSSVTAVTTDLTILPNTPWQIYIGGNELYVAFILSSGTGSCSVHKQTPGPTGIPPMHAAMGPRVTNIGSITTDGSANGSATVTAGVRCFCSGDTGYSIQCSVSSTTLSVVADSALVVINYVCFS